MTMMFRPAVREGVKALALFYGPSGCGKTYSAILAARGLVGPKGRIAFIDTEAGRGSHYAHLTDYDIVQVAPPFTPSRYLEAIEAAEEAGYDALIIDSISHEWEGEGGVLEQAEAAEIRTGKSGLHCWNKPKANHKKLVNRFLRARLHIIFCARAREKPKQVQNGNRTEIVSDGFQPIVEKNFPFEMLISVGMTDTAPGVPDLSLQKKIPGELAPAFPAGQQIGIETGRTIGEWLGGGVPVDRAFADLAEAGREAARSGSETLKAWWLSIAQTERVALAALKDAELKSIAKAADDMAALDEPAGYAPKGPRNGPQDASGEAEDDTGADAPEAPQTPASEPETGQSAQPDQDESTKRFYRDSLTAISKASNADSAKARLAEAERSHFWPEITDGQRENLKTAAKRTK